MTLVEAAKKLKVTKEDLYMEIKRETTFGNCFYRDDEGGLHVSDEIVEKVKKIKKKHRYFNRYL